MDKKMGARTKFSLLYALVALGALLVFQEVVAPMLSDQQEVPYSQFRADVADGRVSEVTLEEERIVYTVDAEEETKDDQAPTTETAGSTYRTVRVEDEDLVRVLVDAGVSFVAKPAPSGLLTSLLGWILPLLPLALIWYFVFRRMGAGGPMSIGKSKAKEITPELTTVTFQDVGGADEVETELKEVIDFLGNPARFTSMGAKLPTGVLLVGPPGTGKTLLAKATAGEAGVPFFSMSGSEFVEMFVGVGASRVRDLFDQAKARAPCIIFIDEIDAIGQSRSSVGVMRGNDEREQTLNQLLYEMDGFESNQGVVIMGASNRPEILDKALLRAGRFDRQIEVPLPTEAGRRQVSARPGRTAPVSKDR